MEIKKLDNKYKDLVGIISGDCFVNDKYFDKISTNKEEKRAKLIEIYKNGFDISIRNGEVFGAFISGELVGYVMIINYKKLKTNIEDYNDIFPLDGDDENYDVKRFIDTINCLSNPQYLLAICVEPIHQKKGIGYNLVEYISKYYNGKEIVSDVDNPHSLSIYKKLNFKITKLSDTYFYVNKNNYIKLKVDDKING